MSFLNIGRHGRSEKIKTHICALLARAKGIWRYSFVFSNQFTIYFYFYFSLRPVENMHIWGFVAYLGALLGILCIFFKKTAHIAHISWNIAEILGIFYFFDIKPWFYWAFGFYLSLWGISILWRSLEAKFFIKTQIDID